MREAGKDMKVLLVLTFVVLTTAGALAFGGADVAAGVAAVVHQVQHATSSSTEPATMLLSGSALLVLAGAIRRFAS